MRSEGNVNIKEEIYKKRLKATNIHFQPNKKVSRKSAQDTEGK